ncbi:MAG: hypothetical protein AAFY28_13870 [Actinomycetota bacterium]
MHRLVATIGVVCVVATCAPNSQTDEDSLSAEAYWAELIVPDFVDWDSWIARQERLQRSQFEAYQECFHDQGEALVAPLSTGFVSVLGPLTAEYAERYGFGVSIEPDVQQIDVGADPHIENPTTESWSAARDACDAQIEQLMAEREPESFATSALGSNETIAAAVEAASQTGQPAVVENAERCWRDAGVTPPQTGTIDEQFAAELEAARRDGPDALDALQQREIDTAVAVQPCNEWAAIELREAAVAAVTDVIVEYGPDAGLTATAMQRFADE